MSELSTLLFDHPGRGNTEAVVACVAARRAALSLGHVVVASSSGDTAVLLRETLPPEVGVVGVTHQVGFAGPGEDELSAETRERLTAQGITLLTTTHLMGGIDRACRFKSEGLYPAEIVAHTLRIFGQGIKVAVEVAVMALDAGLIPHGQEVIAVGGTGRGADAACVLLPAHGHDVFACQVREVLCMPRLKTKAR